LLCLNIIILISKIKLNNYYWNYF